MIVHDASEGTPNKLIFHDFVSFNPIKPDGVSQRHTLHLIASHFYMNEENEVSFHEFLSWTILYPLKK